jgi:hypothetical protein
LRKAHFAQKIEHIVHRLHVLNVFDLTLRARMIDAARRRHFLIHDLLRDRTPSLMTAEGMREVQDELDDYCHTFSQLSDDINRIIDVLATKFGFDSKKSVAFAEQVVANIRGRIDGGDQGAAR